MWMPKDTGTWLAIIALILVVPLNFFSNWAYPKLQNWWTARSRKSLQKRIDKLTALLADMFESRGMSITNEWVLLCTERIATLIFWSVNLLVLVILIMSAPLHRQLQHPNRQVFALTALITIYRVFREVLMAEIRRFRLFAGPMRKIKLEQSIADLTAKLAAREGHKPA